jgi:DNA polymerase-3 subunit alpha
MEKEMLGIYVSGHPLEKIADQIRRQTNINTIQMREIDETSEEEVTSINYKDGQAVKYAGIITDVKKKYTKTNKLMAFVTVEDLYGSAEIIVFENAYMSAENCLFVDNVVLVEGRLSIREDEATKIVAREIKSFSENKENVLYLDITDATESQKAKLRGAVKFFSGEANNTPVAVKVGDEIKPCGTIYFSDKVKDVFVGILGSKNVQL